MKAACGVVVALTAAAPPQRNPQLAASTGCVHVAVAMLYEMIAITRPGKTADVKEIAFNIGAFILRGGGVIRGISNWGVFTLPRPITSHQTNFTHGHHFVVRYDSTTSIHQELRKIVTYEPRLLRTTHVRLGDNKLASLVRFGPPVWRTEPDKV